MVIKVLFFDTNALLKLFLSEPGSETVRWLTSAPVKISNGLRFHINETVVYEFYRKLSEYEGAGDLSAERADQARDKFERHYRDRWFRVVGHNPISRHQRRITLSEVF